MKHRKRPSITDTPLSQLVQESEGMRHANCTPKHRAEHTTFSSRIAEATAKLELVKKGHSFR